jgi:hypothetical protein
MKVFYEENKIDRFPSHETCIQWDLKVGLYKLLRAKQNPSDWYWIVDHVLGEGTVKCLAVLGVPSSFVEGNSDLTLSLTNVEPFGLIPMSNTTGMAVKEALLRVSTLTGVTPRAILSDHGSDLWLGVKEFCKLTENKTTEHYDVCHKVAVELKKLFESDPQWIEFREKAAHSKRLLYNTEGVRYAPPNQRKKGRYQNVDILVRWANRTLKTETSIPSKIKEKLQWVFEAREKIKTWNQWVEIAQHVREEIRCRGFDKGAEERLVARLAPISMSKTSEDLACRLIDYVAFEAAKLPENERALGSTEAIESLFGFYKRIKNGLWDNYGGLGRLILSMASRVGEISRDIVQKALESIRIVDVNNWISKSFSGVLLAT